MGSSERDRESWFLCCVVRCPKVMKPHQIVSRKDPCNTRLKRSQRSASYAEGPANELIRLNNLQTSMPDYISDGTGTGISNRAVKRLGGRSQGILHAGDACKWWYDALQSVTHDTIVSCRLSVCFTVPSITAIRPSLQPIPSRDPRRPRLWKRPCRWSANIVFFTLTVELSGAGPPSAGRTSFSPIALHRVA